MDRPAKSVSEKRLAHVRALKARYFADELTVEEQLAAKDAQIALLEAQVAELEKELARAQRRSKQPQPETSQPENGARATPLQEPAISPESATNDEPQFDFYRD